MNSSSDSLSQSQQIKEKLSEYFSKKQELTPEFLSYQHTLILTLSSHISNLSHALQKLTSENTTLKSQSAQSIKFISEKEQEEEMITNKLLRHISGLKEEKSKLLSQFEQEEEFISNKLQKRLKELEKEKIDLEVAMEQEQEFIVNRLNKQLDELRRSSGQLNYVGSVQSLNQGEKEKVTTVYPTVATNK